MNLARAIQKHEDMAAFYALQGLSKRARIEIERAERLKVARRIKRECSKTFRALDDSVNNIDDCNEVYADASK